MVYVKKRKKKFEIINGGKLNNDDYETGSTFSVTPVYFVSETSSIIDLIQAPTKEMLALVNKSAEENWDDETTEQEIKKFRRYEPIYRK